MKLLPLQEISFTSSQGKKAAQGYKLGARYKKQAHELSKSFSVMDSTNRQLVYQVYLQIQKKFQEVYQLSVRLAAFEGTVGFYEGQIMSIFDSQQQQFNLVYVFDEQDGQPSEY